MAAIRLLLALPVPFAVACEGGGGGMELGDGGADADTDADTDTDADADTDTDTDADTDSDADADTDTDADADTDSDADADEDQPVCIDDDSDGWCLPFDCDDEDPDVNPGMQEIPDNDIDDNCNGLTDEAPGSIHGTVMAPSSTFPIPGALVYVTGQSVEEINTVDPIPNGVFCYACDDMTGKRWTLSNPDGTFAIENVPAGTWRLVSRKGFFRRIVEITVGNGEALQVPISQTTLPFENSADGADRIAAYAVALNSWDRSQDLLAKLGIADLNSSGNVVFGTENFDIYNSSMTQSGYPDVLQLYSTLEYMSQYHMIFMPCTSGYQKSTILNNSAKRQQIRDYVEAGGKYYGSCYAYDWVEQPFPEPIEFLGNDATMGSATVSSYNTYTTLTDQQMRDWISVVSPSSNPDSFYVTGAWVVARGVDNVNNGMGLEEDNYWVIPRVWTWNNSPNSSWSCLGPNNRCPMTVTYNWGCGKVFFSAYHVVESSSSVQIRPQEYVLLYLILEVGVCEGSYVPLD